MQRKKDVVPLLKGNKFRLSGFIDQNVNRSNQVRFLFKKKKKNLKSLEKGSK